ncbi:hypothetical protein AB205_0160880 [Aquarana catesbeiana]|uniref:Uncharacterized protein n=1 Tax=Aquarana catesbeiana TaxID=8400 RepID=A0A2G9P7P9_AQUCT|nr:hypothetical protein AB205_0160880 [Aquarana catesbeiana]
MASQRRVWTLTSTAPLCQGPIGGNTAAGSLVSQRQQDILERAHTRMPSRKRKEGSQPGKLPDYFLLQHHYVDQDGGGKQRERTRGSHTQSSAASHPHTGQHNGSLGRGQPLHLHQ